jgi:hypothetical protein
MSINGTRLQNYFWHYPVPSKKIRKNFFRSDDQGLTSAADGVRYKIMMKYGCVMLGIYLGGQVAAWAINYEMNGVFLAYTSQSSIARNAVESFVKLNPQYEKSLDEKREDVTVKLAQKKDNKSYKIQQIVEGGNVIYRAVDTPEELWYILREFGPGTEFTCDDVFHSSVLVIDHLALRDFVRDHVIALPLNDRTNIEMVLFFAVLMDHFDHDPTLLQMVLRELQALARQMLARMRGDDGQWTEEELQALIEHATGWLGIRRRDLVELDLEALNPANTQDTRE